MEHAYYWMTTLTHYIIISILLGIYVEIKKLNKKNHDNFKN